MTVQIAQMAQIAQTLAWLQQRTAPNADLHSDSRKLRSGDAFIAWPGGVHDGRAFVAQALAQGASACIVEQSGCERFEKDWPANAPILRFSGLKAATSALAANWYGQPAQKLKVLAITGTNGKTSTAWWLAHAMQHCAMMGTLGVGLPPNFVSTGMTTPDPVRLQQSLAQLVQQGATACALEASSIGIAEQRLDAQGLAVHTAIFTNFSQDHLDYHQSMAAYWQAKAQLFDWPHLRAAVINIDDSKGVELAAYLRRQRPEVALWTLSTKQSADIQALDIRYTPQGLHFVVAEGEQRCAIANRMIGHYNISNLLGVLATLRSVGMNLADAVAACTDLPPVPGRMEQCSLPNQSLPLVAVDYAHTPDALQQALAALRPLATARGGRLWCVFGCGGNRDASKRPLMGQVAQAGADCVVLTSDNPRHENPQAILDAVITGVSADDGAKWHIHPERGAAIAEAIAQAAPQDVLLIAGKGHENYQEIGGIQHPFCDMQVARQALQRRERH